MPATTLSGAMAARAPQAHQRGGERATYHGRAGSVSTHVVINRSTTERPARHQSTVPARDITADVLLSDIPAPERGDVIQMNADDIRYTVDAIQDLDDVVARLRVRKT